MVELGRHTIDNPRHSLTMIVLSQGTVKFIMVEGRPQRGSMNHIDRTGNWVAYGNGKCEWME